MPPMPPLLLFDLDNTLVDRDQAFREWAARFLAERSLPAQDLAWFVVLDCGGYHDRRSLFRAAVDRYGLDEPLPALLAEYRDTVTALIRCPSAHFDALRTARAAGWTLGIVTNGATAHQETKIKCTGLADLVDGWVVSEEADCVKPDPRIFRIAAERCGVRTGTGTGTGWNEDTWMIGDHAPADIAGAQVADIRSVWLAHGRPWPETGYSPTLIAATLPDAVSQVLGTGPAPSAPPRTTGAAARPGLRYRGAELVGCADTGRAAPG
jgi:putative hydrolase of the HAD superfamily